ncbi:MAG: radical SAM protein [Thermoplasmatales archaeon]|nr:radical SAM protein [Thermoplasmatales archaeon]MCW6170671.1 radical SAM protein [Thermoplasmatales archaeon]
MQQFEIHSKNANGIISIEYGRKYVYSFDLEGRLLNYINEGKTYRRTLQNHLISSRIVPGERISEEVLEREAQNIVDRAYDEIRRISPSIQGNDVIPFLSKIESMNWQKLQLDAAKLIRIYSGSVPIVPPDQYFAVYIMLERGCKWNRCSFCELYRDREFRILSLEDVAKQIADLERFFGRGIESRRSIFIGEANAMSLPQDLLLSAIKLLNSHFRLPIYSFSEPFTGHGPKTVEELEELRSHGLKRVYVGLESGSRKILRLINKPMDLNVFRDYVHRLKASGISVGIIVMLGIGGRNLYDEHVRETVDIIKGLNLDNGDIVYLSPFIQYPGFKYSDNTEQIIPLSHEEVMGQGAEIHKVLVQLKDDRKSNHGFPVALYNLLEAQY